MVPPGPERVLPWSPVSGPAGHLPFTCNIYCQQYHCQQYYCQQQYTLAGTRVVSEGKK